MKFRVGKAAGETMRPGRTNFVAPMSRIVAAITAAAAIAIMAWTGYSYWTARQADAALANERRAALSANIADMRVLFHAGNAGDARVISVLENSSGITGLKFQTEPSGTDDEQQPVLDAQGRIAGFLTWRNAQPMTDMVTKTIPAAAAVAVALLFFGAWTLRRLRHAAEHANARLQVEAESNNQARTASRVMQRLDVALANRDIQQVVGFAIIELDDLSAVQSHVGGQGAEEVVAAIGERLAAALPEGAEIGRGAGDSFYIMIPGASDLTQHLNEALRAVSQPYWINAVVRIGAHAGFAQAPRDAITRDELSRAAHVALRAAAKKGPGTVVAYERSLIAMSDEHQFIRRELPRALAANELELHYQPILAAQSGDVRGVEALLRWNHPQRGSISPAQFIPVAEHMGIMDQIGEFVLRRAMLDARRWPGFYVGVNLSPVQVKGPEIVELVRQCLEEARLEPERLVLEITEGVLVDNPDEMIKRVNDLRALGVRIALDDFGSGYSNLSYLHRFPIDKLKIDRAFVAPLGKASNAGVFIQAIVTLGRALGLKVVAEGVETEEQRILLRMAGCDELQGFLFARALPVRAVDKLAAENYAARSAQQPVADGINAAANTRLTASA